MTVREMKAFLADKPDDVQIWVAMHEPAEYYWKEIEMVDYDTDDPDFPGIVIDCGAAEYVEDIWEEWLAEEEEEAKNG